MSARLHNAIQLRRVVHRTLDVNDDEALRFWNRRADRALLALNPEEFADYSLWVDSTMTDEDRRDLDKLVSDTMLAAQPPAQKP